MSHRPAIGLTEHRSGHRAQGSLKPAIGATAPDPLDAAIEHDVRRSANGVANRVFDRMMAISLNLDPFHRTPALLPIQQHQFLIR